ncbi:MAG: long-chain acyl-CoA synthetase [Acidobacteriota bacterium]|jgi:long-chain acyl-CoA synthetase|nr:long-chain acyl-CoA synthetase [Acidobacteriota bacterium]
MKLSPTEVFQDRKIFLIGSTGFLGKVTLSMLLHRFPNIGRVYVTVRARSREESHTRFWNNVITAPPFDPLRERYGDAFEDFIRDKVSIVAGDIGETNLGYSEEEAQSIADDVDVIINSAGNVTFNPTLESALRTNVVGTENVIQFTKRMKRPALVHVSTCFVAGNRSGAVWESDPVVGYFPRREEDEMQGVEFSVEHEIRDCAKLADRVREEARDAMMAARFRELARKRLIEEGRDPDDLDSMGLAVARERKVWTRTRLTDLGVERAAWWGWPNIYTYTKSLGEQLVAAEDGIIRTIVRPSIVESALSYPFPGWNEGFTTTAPLIFIALKGQSLIPVNEKLILDITPVDQVAAVMLAVSAQACVEEPRLVHQACTGDSNPNDMRRIVGLLGLYKRKHFLHKDSGFKIVNQVAARMETKPVTPAHFDRTSTPMINSAAKKVSNMLDRVRPRWGGGRISEVIDRVKQNVDRFEELTRETQEAFEMFRPFTVENAYIFRADNVRSLMSRIRKDEQPLLAWHPDKYDWYDYWMNTHFPGLEKWVFPKLEEDMRAQPKRVYTYRDLLELFETTTKRHATRVAMRIERHGRKEQYTYADMRELATRAAGFFVDKGIKPGERIMLLSHNAPEWGMTYFGVIKAGAICIPVDPENSLAKIVSFARAGDAAGIVMSSEMANKHQDLAAKLVEGGLTETRLWQFEEVFAMPDEQTEEQRIALLPSRVQAQSIASLIFTSGTTGQPKAVMLSHRNLTSMTSMLSSIIDMTTSDGVLSVLPLHHTFEFSTGFLAPLSRGAQITYMEELTSEALTRAIKNGHVTGMVGVPAVWELLHRRIRTKFNERSALVGKTADLLIRANIWLRDNTPINLGPLIFQPIHKGLGGRIRYLISGGSALNEQVQKDFHGLGFTILEGYGLTEASPVLTVTRPRNKLVAGTVGKPLPGIEVKILEPNASGIGEVIARGPNVMVGYYENEDATRQTLINRWLHTGDIGKLDEDGNLFLVGRSKEVIIDTSGKNVYPDEVEEAYDTSAFVRELSVVGLPDGIGEKVACMVVPNYEHDATLSREEIRKRVEEHFRDISSTLPFYKRVKVLHFWDNDLPRTATRKVKRNEVLETIEVLEKSAKATSRVAAREEKAGDVTWLLNIVSAVSSRPRSEITFNSRLSDLGFDSLMYVELATAIENAGGTLTSPDTLMEVHDLRELANVVTRQPSTTKRKQPARAEKEREPDDEIHIPAVVRNLGNKGLDALQRVFYEKLLHTKYEGRTNIPVHTNFIVAPNHTSHLDMGLAKMALGEAGRDLVALAAADYFFDNKYKRAYMENFTNLVPIERSGSLRQSLRHARSFLDRGFNALIFPEGTRSLTGEIAEFKPITGYLALACRVGILPMYLVGTHDAMPKGSNIIRSREIAARIGRFLTYEELEELTTGMPRAEAYRLIAALVQHSVENLRDGTRNIFDAKALRRRWKDERRAARLTTDEDERDEHLTPIGD